MSGSIAYRRWRVDEGIDWLSNTKPMTALALKSGVIEDCNNALQVVFGENHWVVRRGHRVFSVSLPHPFVSGVDGGARGTCCHCCTKCEVVTHKA